MKDKNKSTKEKIDEMLSQSFADILLSSILKYVCWIALLLTMAAIVIIFFLENFDISLTSKNSSVFAILLIICSIINHSMFQATGISSGRNADDYKAYATKYDLKRRNRKRGDIDDYINESRKKEKESFIKKVEGETGKTEEDIRKMSLKEIKKSKEYTRKLRRLMRKLVLRQYPDTSPKNSALMLNVIEYKTSPRYSVIDVKQKNRYLARANTTWLIRTIGFMFFMAGISAQFVSEINTAETVLKIILSLLSLCSAVIGGYIKGLRAISVMEKNSLMSACQFFSDMDIWLKEQGRKTRYTPDEFTSKESTTDNHN